MSLKAELKKRIKEKGEISYNEVEDYCRMFNFKTSNAERRMREVCNEGEIEPVMKKGYICGWKVREEQMSLFA